MRCAAVLVLAACGASPPRVRLDEAWHTCRGDYLLITDAWTRRDVLRGQYQEIAELYGVFLSPDWRAAHASKLADLRKLTGEARDKLCAQAQADMAGPYEVELLFTTWERRENDLDRGKKSMWRTVLVDDQGQEIEALEIVKDPRSSDVHAVRDEFPAAGDFSRAYIARFPRTTPVLGPSVRSLHLRMTSERGGLELVWEAP